MQVKEFLSQLVKRLVSVCKHHKCAVHVFCFGFDMLRSVLFRSGLFRFSCLVLPCPVLSCLVLSGPVLPCFVLFCSVLFCSVLFYSIQFSLVLFNYMLFYFIPGFTSIDRFTVMSAVCVLTFNFKIITSVVKDQLMMNAVFVLRQTQQPVQPLIPRSHKPSLVY